MSEDTEQVAVDEAVMEQAEEPETPPADEPPQDAPPTPEPPDPQPTPCRPAGGVAGWPFLVYLAAWAALAASTGLVLTGADATPMPLDDPRYPALLLTGLVLAACGPLLALVTWVVAFARTEKGCRGGLLTIALVRGASATLFGVIVWWGALILVDALRLGLI